MQSPMEQPGEAGEQVLQVLQSLPVLETLEAVAEEVKPLIVTTATVVQDGNSNLLPGRISGPSTQTSQVGHEQVQLAFRKLSAISTNIRAKTVSTNIRAAILILDSDGVAHSLFIEKASDVILGNAYALIIFIIYFFACFCFELTK